MKRLSKALVAVCFLLVISGCAGRIAEPTQTKFVEPEEGKKSLSLYHFYKKETFGLSASQVAGILLAATVAGALAGATSVALDNLGFQDNQLIASMITSTWIAGDMAQQQSFQRTVEQAIDKAEMNSSVFQLKYTQKGMVWSKASREVSYIITPLPGQIDTYGECFVNSAAWYCAAEVGCGHLFGKQTVILNPEASVLGGKTKVKQWIEDEKWFGKCVSDALDVHIGQMQKCRILTAPQQQDYLTAFIERAKGMKKIVDEFGENYALEYYKTGF